MCDRGRLRCKERGRVSEFGRGFMRRQSNECLSDLPKQDLWDFNASKGNCSCEDCTIEAFLIFL